MTKFLLIALTLIFAQNTFAQSKTRNLCTENWSFKQNHSSIWHKAYLPSVVHTDLFANKLILDPLFGDNEKQLQWIEEKDWVYKTDFVLSANEVRHQNIKLQCLGLDTYATVFVNDVQVGKADNMFRTWTFDIKKHLKKGKNNLCIVFASAVNYGKTQAALLPYSLPEKERVFCRKAQYHFGWDWGPRFVTAGVYKGINLVFEDDITIQNIRQQQDLKDTACAKINFLVSVDCKKTSVYTISYNDSVLHKKIEKGAQIITLPYQIKQPKRWWCNGMGKAHLYDFNFKISKNKKICATQQQKVGLRTIELVQEKDSVGQSFYFKINGKPVFMKGANYIPPHIFLNKTTSETYKTIVENARNVHINMLRVWGGGVYADDAFYDYCDANGILVWQDFMFACAMYPADKTFLENVQQEATEQISRLQHHASIALWCGNNESDEGWHNWGWQKQFNYSAKDSTEIWRNYKKLFHELLPKTLDSIAPKTLYWSSSPSLGWGRKAAYTQGDVHYWGVWWGNEPFEKYEEKVGRFVSEYGFQSMPALTSFKQFVADTALNLQSNAVKSHQKHPTGYKTIQDYMERDYRVPTTFADYIYVSQLVQADGMKTAITAHRRAKPYCMGSLFWQWNDCWGVTSWSAVDFYNTKKAFYYQLKQSFAPVLVSTQKQANGYDIVVINDKMQALNGVINIKIMDFNGKMLYETTENATVGANTAKKCLFLNEKTLSSFDKKSVFAKIDFIENGKTHTELLYFAKPKDLNLPSPDITTIKIDETHIEVRSKVLIKNCYLTTFDNAEFSDNFFDLLPNESKVISVNKPFRLAVVVQSLNDL